MQSTNRSSLDASSETRSTPRYQSNTRTHRRPSYALSAFNTNNPIMKRAGLSVQDYRAYALLSCSKVKSVDTGLSLVARSADGELLAFLFLKTFDPYQKTSDFKEMMRKKQSGV